jgi:hypothetical protein
MAATSIHGLIQSRITTEPTKHTDPMIAQAISAFRFSRSLVVKSSVCRFHVHCRSFGVFLTHSGGDMGQRVPLTKEVFEDVPKVERTVATVKGGHTRYRTYYLAPHRAALAWGLPRRCWLIRVPAEARILAALVES